MKLYSIKNTEKELYFQVEKTKEGLMIIDEIGHKLFNDTGYCFENRWQEGSPQAEDY